MILSSSWKRLLPPPIAGFDRKSIRLQIDQLNNNNKPIFISLERLAGNPFQGGADGELIANRLKDIFPTAKILITIRNQSKMIDSLYKQYIFQGGGLNFQAFIKGTVRSSLYFSIDYLKYDALVSYYQNQYGKENVLVLPYELLSENPSTYFSRLNSFFDFNKLGHNQFENSKRLNSSYKISTTALEFMRLCNSFYSTWAQPKRVFPGIKYHKKLRKNIQGKLGKLLTNKQSELSYITLHQKAREINDYYGNSNRSLAKEFELNLEDLGYPMPRQ